MRAGLKQAAENAKPTYSTKLSAAATPSNGPATGVLQKNAGNSSAKMLPDRSALSSDMKHI